MSKYVPVSRSDPRHRPVFIIQGEGRSSSCGAPWRSSRGPGDPVAPRGRLDSDLLVYSGLCDVSSAVQPDVDDPPAEGSVAVVLKKTLVCPSCSSVSLHQLTS